jgi:hypothetical protein
MSDNTDLCEICACKNECPAEISPKSNDCDFRPIE